MTDNNNKTPTLYSVYEDKFNYDDLQKAYDAGLFEYLSTVKRGEKDKEAFIDAGNALMSGIKDGSITFSGGRFIDLQGRYKNDSQNKNKDYFGIMANYINKVQKGINKYQDPEENKKIPWLGNSSFGIALHRNIFNSDSGNYQDLIDMDDVDRTTIVSSGIQHLIDNYDNLFSGYNDYDKARNLTYLNEALESLKDGSIDKGDYFKLNRAIQGFDFRKVFSKPEINVQNTPTNTPVQPTQQTEPVQPSEPTLQSYFSITSNVDQNDYGKLYNWYKEGTTNKALNYLKSYFTNPNFDVPNDYYASSGVSNFDKSAAVIASLEALKDQGALHPYNNSTFQFIIPELSDDTKTVIYDSNAYNLQYINTPIGSDMHSKIKVYSPLQIWDNLVSEDHLPIVNNAVSYQTPKYNGTFPDDYLEERFADYTAKFIDNKPRYSNGKLVWKSEDGEEVRTIVPIETALLYRLKMVKDNPKFMTKSGDKYLINGKTSEDGKTIMVFDDTNNVVIQASIDDFPDFKKAVKEQTKNGVVKAQQGTKLPTYIGQITESPDYNWYRDHYSLWSKDLFNYASGKDKKAIAELINSTQAKHVPLYKQWDRRKAYQNDDVKDYQSRINENFPYINSVGVTSNIINKNFILPYGANTSDKPETNFTPDGYFSAYTDSRRILGRSGDYAPEQLNKTVQQWKDHGFDFYLEDDNYYRIKPIPLHGYPAGQTIYKKALEFKLPQKLDSSVQSEKSSVINPTESIITKSKFLESLKNINPNVQELSGVGRLLLALRTNNDIANKLKENMYPVLKDTYELAHPVTGAFTQMQHRNQLAANLRNQAAKPMTSDTSLSLATMLAANKQATEIEKEGHNLDAQEILRTSTEAIRRQEDNIARRFELSNFNRASIAQTLRERDQVDVMNKRKNWESLDEYLRGMEERALKQQLLKGQVNYQNEMLRLDQEYDKKTRPLMDRIIQWRSTGKPVEQMPNYSNIISAMQEAKAWRQRQNLRASMLQYNYTPPSSEDSLDLILAKYSLHNGGKLKPLPTKLIAKK